MNEASIFGPGVASVWKRKRKQRAGLTPGRTLPPEISNKLGEAELLFINGNNEKAIELLSDVSSQAPKLPEPYSIMALIYESSGDKLRALQLYTLTAAHTPKNNHHLWLKVIELASAIGEWDRALMAIRKCLQIQPSLELHIEKIRILTRQRNIVNAKHAMRVLLSRYPNSEHIHVEFGDLVRVEGYTDLAVDHYVRYITHLLGTRGIRTDILSNSNQRLPTNQPAKSSVYIMEHIEILYRALHHAVDIVLDKPEAVGMALELIEVCSEWTLSYRASLPPDANLSEVPELPMSTCVMYAVCKLRLEQEDEAERALSILKPILQSVDQREILPHLCEVDSIDSLEGYSSEQLVLDLDILRQLMRTTIELVAAGMITRASKLIHFVDSCLTSVCDAAALLQLDVAVVEMIPQIWCQLGGTYESVDHLDHALHAYKVAIYISTTLNVKNNSSGNDDDDMGSSSSSSSSTGSRRLSIRKPTLGNNSPSSATNATMITTAATGNDTANTSTSISTLLQLDSMDLTHIKRVHVASLCAYCRLVRSDFPIEMPVTSGLLERHILALIEEFDALRENPSLLPEQQSVVTAVADIHTVGGLKRRNIDLIATTSSRSSTGKTVTSNNDARDGGGIRESVGEGGGGGGGGGVEEGAVTWDPRNRLQQDASLPIESSIRAVAAAVLTETKLTSTAIANFGDEMLLPSSYDMGNMDLDDLDEMGLNEAIDLDHIIDDDDDDDDDDDEEDMDVVDDMDIGVVEEDGASRLLNNKKVTATVPLVESELRNEDEDEDGEEEEEEEEEEQKFSGSHLHWRVSGQSHQFTQDSIHWALKALVEWAEVLHDKATTTSTSTTAQTASSGISSSSSSIRNGLKAAAANTTGMEVSEAIVASESTSTTDWASYLSIILPVLDHWLEHVVNTATLGRSSRKATTGIDVTRKLRNKDAHVVSMYQLATSRFSECYVAYHWLDTVQNSCARFVGALVSNINVEHVFSRDVLLKLVTLAAEALEQLAQSDLAASLLRRSQTKTIEHVSQSTGRARQRISGTQYIEYSAMIDGDDADDDDDGQQRRQQHKGHSGSQSVNTMHESPHMWPFGASPSHAFLKPSDAVNSANDLHSQSTQPRAQQQQQQQQQQQFYSVHAHSIAMASASVLPGASAMEDSTHRSNTSKRNTASFSTSLDTAGGTGTGGIGGGGGSGGSMSWNRMRRTFSLKEDPLVVAAAKVSQTAAAAAVRLLSQPNDVTVANAFYLEVLGCLDPFSLSSSAVELSVPLNRLFAKAPDSLPAAIFAAHDYGAQRMHQRAIESYLRAFWLDPQQPMVSLSLGCYLIMLSQHKLSRARHEILVKGLSFLHRYLALRRNSLQEDVRKLADTACNSLKTSATGTGDSNMDPGGNEGSEGSEASRNEEQDEENIVELLRRQCDTLLLQTHAQQQSDCIFELGVYQETIYNLGRAFHGIRLYHLAVDMYEQALRLADICPILADTERGYITPVAAHNLVLIYKYQTKSKHLALDVMEKYLVM